MIIEGEIVVIGEDGGPDFAARLVAGAVRCTAGGVLRVRRRLAPGQGPAGGRNPSAGGTRTAL
jgi:hypothetical protein